MDQIRDQVEDHEEVSLAMSEGIGQNDMIDESELFDELAELEMEGLDDQLSQLSMPSTPSAAPQARSSKKSEADEMRELEMMMGV